MKEKAPKSETPKRSYRIEEWLTQEWWLAIVALEASSASVLLMQGQPAGNRAAVLPRWQLDILRVVVGAQIQNRVYQLDPLHLQNFHI